MTTAIVHSFNDTSIRQRPDDGYVDATAMCQANGKRWVDYFENNSTQEFLAALSKVENLAPLELVQTKPGRYGGTWVHPHVAIHLGQWCSTEFAVFVSQLVFAWMTGKAQPPQDPSPHPDFRDLLLNSDLTRAELRVLALLDQAQTEGELEELSDSEMASRLQIDRRTVTRVLKRLQDLGMVEVQRQVKYRLQPMPLATE